MSRLPRTAHRALPWRIHEIAPDFEIEDVWSYRAPGAGPDDFGVMLAAIRAAGGPGSSSRLSHALFALRWRLGKLFGWDNERDGLGARVSSLRDRLPEDLRGTAETDPPGSPFTSLYRLPREAAREIANGTVHAVMHLGWAEGDGGWELRMAVLVRPNGWFGRMYLAAILPFRLLIVYPAMTRQWEGAWRTRMTVGRAAGFEAAE
ncbi:DUF2867 domain-containing protein [Arthrobacter globiformis]|uniref:DUF2867 domain-containing protein n=1 Tax=Arthrobacter globiformis TaxID=1665 RepID=UPI002781A54C|nr:DUF2867 domain-containing protein [Arthrobacter globiformis]MDQ0863724.1 hypothetical protein [Arthrobacter globiformis]